MKYLPTPTVGESKGTRNRTAIRKAQDRHHDGETLTDVFYRREGQVLVQVSFEISDQTFDEQFGQDEEELEDCLAARLNEFYDPDGNVVEPFNVKIKITA